MSRMRKKHLVLAGAAVLLAIVAGLLFLFTRQQNLNDIDVIKERIGRHYILPTDEQPALVTVTDKSKVASQFLKKADNGDKVLLYQKNQRAIVYRPSVDRIVDVGFLSIDTVTQKD